MIEVPSFGKNRLEVEQDQEDPVFCEDRVVVVLQDPEATTVEVEANMLTLAVNMSLPMGEERVIIYKDDEVPLAAQVEEARCWESDADVDAWSEGAARGLSSPALTPDEEQLVEQYLRVASPDIKARFPKPVWDMTGMERAGPDELKCYLAEYGTKCEMSRSTEPTGSRPRYGGVRGRRRSG